MSRETSPEMRRYPPLDDALLDAYRRREAPPGFARRVAARIPDRRPARAVRWRWPALAAAALAIAALAPIVLLNDTGRGVTDPDDTLVSIPTFPSSPSDAGELNVPGLSAIADIPLFPASPEDSPDTPHDAADPRWEGKAVPKSDRFRYVRLSKEPTDDHG